MADTQHSQLWLSAFPDLARIADEAWLEAVQAAQEMRVPAGTAICRPDDPCVNFVLLAEGAIHVFESSEDGRELVLYRVQPGEMCFMTAIHLLDQKPYSATAMTEGATRLIVIPGHLFQNALTRSDAFRGYVMATLARRLGDVMKMAGQAVFTERERNEQVLDRQLLYDALTDLPNRHLLNDRLAQAISAAARDNGACALLILDLDDFKEINDTLGHTAGDTLLKQIAPRLRGCVRDTDTLARMGGDEFAVVLPTAQQAQAERVARKILEALNAPFDVEGITTQVTVSIGIAQYPHHGRRPEELLRHADVAMYAAKHDRTGYALYAPEGDSHNSEDMTLSGELGHALEHDELTLYYQPILRLSDRALVGMEALVRWRHPQRGLILPRDFIPLAEHQNLIRPLTLWVIECTARQSADWHALGLDIPIAVNLSPMLLRDATFIGEAIALLDSNNNASPWLELEVTENALMENPSLVLERLQPLRARGVRLSIDDFGTGYSSLSYLHEFRVDTLKIDHSFIDGLATDENKAIIVRAIVQLAHNLGFEVVAEGAENQETCDRLRVLGCDYVQGYHLGRPMPAADCLRWVDELLSTQRQATS